jgi:hypothetical protein
MKSLRELLKLDQRERDRIEEEQKEIEGGERAMAIAVVITVVLGIIIVGLILAALTEALIWTK